MRYAVSGTLWYSADVAAETLPETSATSTKGSRTIRRRIRRLSIKNLYPSLNSYAYSNKTPEIVSKTTYGKTLTPIGTDDLRDTSTRKSGSTAPIGPIADLMFSGQDRVAIWTVFKTSGASAKQRNCCQQRAHPRHLAHFTGYCGRRQELQMARSLAFLLRGLSLWSNGTIYP